MAENLSGQIPSTSEGTVIESYQERSLRVALSRSALEAILVGLGLAAIFIAYLAAVQFATPALAGVDG